MRRRLSLTAVASIGLSETTAIIVTGDRFEVMGAWKVAVHDNTRLYQPWEKPYFVLSHGDVYNMKTRTVEKYGTGVRGRGGNPGGGVTRGMARGAFPGRASSISPRSLRETPPTRSTSRRQAR